MIKLCTSIFYCAHGPQSENPRSIAHLRIPQHMVFFYSIEISHKYTMALWYFRHGVLRGQHHVCRKIKATLKKKKSKYCWMCDPLIAKTQDSTLVWPCAI